jgi:DsbC/DsbD-like thiol-disulfide interchange protein
VTARLVKTATIGLLFLATFHMPASAQAVSPWIEDGAARLRLVAGEAVGQGSLLAGLEISLQPGWKTYWINPGPTGIPPQLDFTGSKNLKSAQALWPAPVRFDDGGTEAVGYKGLTVIPLRIEPERAGEPVTLKATLDFGLCENICVPARTEISIELRPDLKPDALAAARLAGFAKRVPAAAKLGGDAPLAITALVRTEKGLGVSVRFPDNAKVTDLFASAAEGKVGIPEKIGTGSYRIGLKSAPALIELVAVADGHAIRVPVALDGPAAKP